MTDVDIKGEPLLNGPMTRILYDGLNLSLEKGTGIATYTRNLINAARGAGFRTAAAYALPDNVPSNAILRTIALFDGRARKLSLLERWSEFGKAQLGFFRTLPVRKAELPGVVEATYLETSGRSGDEVWAGKQIFRRARLSFRVSETFSDILAADPPDLAHFTAPLPLRLRGAANVYTIHDLVPMRLPYASIDDKRIFYSIHREIARIADHIVTVSEASRQDIIRWLGVSPDRVTNTYQAISIPDHLLAKDEDIVANELGGLFGLEPGGYFLFYGAIEPKKNVRRLLEAFLSSGLDLPLVIVSSSGWQNEAELAIIGNKWFQRRGLGGGARRPKLKPISYAPYELLVSLIKGARAVTFPSLYEGFGLPVLEAMTLGTPVLTSNTSSLPEVAGDAAILVDPLDVDAIRRGLVTLASDTELCRDLSQRSRRQAEIFSPERYRTRVVELYSKLGFAPASRQP